jgi:hypothetical protein
MAQNKRGSSHDLGPNITVKLPGKKPNVPSPSKKKNGSLADWIKKDA